jgi:hypothetical protein
MTSASVAHKVFAQTEFALGLHGSAAEPRMSRFYFSTASYFSKASSRKHLENSAA